MAAFVELPSTKSSAEDVVRVFIGEFHYSHSAVQGREGKESLGFGYGEKTGEHQIRWGMRPLYPVHLLFCPFIIFGIRPEFLYQK